MTTPDSVPTCNEEAERAVLGIMLLDNTCIPSVSAILAASDFSARKLQVTYEVILGLRAHGQPADLITVSARLRELGGKGDVGTYVLTLTNAIPTSGNLEHYARIVHELASKRRAEALATEYLEGRLENSAYLEQIAALRNGQAKPREVRVLGVQTFWNTQPSST